MGDRVGMTTGVMPANGAVGAEACKMKPCGEDLPLVTFALFAYNQEKYIREAVEGALAQDYPNLEIIISDDSSTDETWKIIESYGESYSGPHRLRLNRNKVNLGIGTHVNRLFEMATGELIVVAAGDDVSLWDRVSLSVEAWLRAGRPEGVLHGQAAISDELGIRTGAVKGSDMGQPSISEYARRDFGPLIHGATAAYTPTVMRFFGPLTCDIEDVPLTFRSLLIGKLIFINRTLINYRTGAGNVSSLLRRSDRDRAGRWSRMQVARVAQHCYDYITYCDEMQTRPSRRVLLRLKFLKWRYSAAGWTASDNTLKNCLGLLIMPIGGGVRDRVYALAAYFGLK